MTDPRAAGRMQEILVVDDVPEIGQFFSLLLSRVEAPIRLTTAVSSAEAIATLRERPFDLVISDFRMPGPDGIEVLRTAREAHPECGRILMTGYNEIPAEVGRIRAASVDAYVQKPLRSPDLLLLVLDFLAKHPGALAASRAQAREIEANAERESGARGL